MQRKKGMPKAGMAGHTSAKSSSSESERASFFAGGLRFTGFAAAAAFFGAAAAFLAVAAALTAAALLVDGLSASVAAADVDAPAAAPT